MPDFIFSNMLSCYSTGITIQTAMIVFSRILTVIREKVEYLSKFYYFCGDFFNKIWKD